MRRPITALMQAHKRIPHIIPSRFRTRRFRAHDQIHGFRIYNGQFTRTDAHVIPVRGMPTVESLVVVEPAELQDVPEFCEFGAWGTGEGTETVEEGAVDEHGCP